jgi:hypothetical protein
MAAGFYTAHFRSGLGFYGLVVPEVNADDRPTYAAGVFKPLPFYSLFQTVTINFQIL